MQEPHRPHGGRNQYAFLFFPARRSLLMITGVSCGIPDFRSRDGLYAQLHDSGIYDLEDPQRM